MAVEHGIDRGGSAGAAAAAAAAAAGGSTTGKDILDLLLAEAGGDPGYDAFLYWNDTTNLWAFAAFGPTSLGLTDPGADRIPFWDDSASAMAWSTSTTPFDSSLYFLPSANLNGVAWTDSAGNFTSGTDGAQIFKFTNNNLYFDNYDGGNFLFRTSSYVTQLVIAHTASAANYMQVTGGPAGGTPTITMQGSDADVGLDLATKGSDPFRFFTNSTAQQFAIAHTASAVNYITVTGASGGLPYFLAAGSSTDIAIGHYSKGAGAHYFYSHSGGNLQFIIDPVASSVNYARLAPSVAGLAVQLYLEGTDTDINMLYSTKGAGSHQFWTHNRTYRAFQVLNDAAPSAYAQIYNAGGTGYWSHIHSSGTLYIGTSGTGGFAFYTDNSGSTVQFAIARTASAVDYHQFTGAATGSNQAILWSAEGSDSTIAIGIKPKGAAGCVQLGPETGVTSNPTRVLQIRPGGTGRSQLGLQGYDSAGAGQMAIDFIANDGTALGAIGTVSVTGNPIIYTSPTAHSFNTGAGAYGGGNRQFYVAHTASAVNYLQVTGSATGDYPHIVPAGSDTNIGIKYYTKGSGAHNFYTSESNIIQFAIAHTASAVNYVQVTGGATGSPGIITMSAQGSDSDVQINLTPKGSGAVSVLPTSDSHLYGGLQFYRSNGSSRGAVVQGADDNTYLGNQAAGNVNFFSNGDASFQTNFVISHVASASRYITVAGATGSGNPTISTSGGSLALGNGQLTYPATQNASSDANTLDDYEEGSWTPTVGGTSTYSSQTGYYCKIGEQFIMWWDFTISSIGTGSTSIVSGCPFTATTGKQGTGSGYWSGWSGTYVYSQPVDNGSATMRPYGATAAAGGLSPLAPFQNGARWFGQVIQGI